MNCKKEEQKKERNDTYKCANPDNAIDAEVYKLYGLTEEEIKTVEGKEIETK